MERAPLCPASQCSSRKPAIALSCHDVHSRLKFTIDCIKVRRSVVAVVHGDYDTKKSTEFRYLPNYSAEARRFRLVALSDLTRPNVQQNPLLQFTDLVADTAPVS